MDTARLRRVCLIGSSLIAGPCIVAIVLAVVIEGTDGRLADGLAVVAVAALTVAWRLHRHTEHDAETD